MGIADQYADWIVKNADKKGTPDFDTVVKAYQDSLKGGSFGAQSKANSDAQDQRIRDSVTGDMSGVAKFVAGYGSAVPRLVRGVGQRLGLVSQADADEANARDKALLATGAGGAGNLAGNVAAAVPTAFVPGANTIAGSAVIGAGLGLAQPTSTGESVGRNVAIGAAGAPLGLLAGRAIGAGYQGAKALAEPFYEAGRNRIAGRVIGSFAEDPSRIASATSNPTITGARPTLAEQTGDRGIAQLQDALETADPRFANQLGARYRENNAARVNALSSIAGDSTQRTAAETARSAATKPLYDQATQQTVPITPELQALFSRPSVQKAMVRAAELAKEQGRTFGIGSGGKIGTVSGQTLQDLKMGMDALLKDPTSGIAGAEAGSVRATRDALVDQMEKSIPAFKAARTVYADASKPINAMDVGDYLTKRATSNLTDLSGNPRMQANGLLKLLRDEPALTKAATGRPLGSLDNVLSPGQRNVLDQIASETDRAAAVSSAGAGKGSPTAQRLATQNILRQGLGSLGVPQGVADSTFMQTIAKPLNLLYGGVAEPKIQQALAEAVLNPAKAQAMIRAAAPAQRPALVQFFQRSAAARSATTANALANRP